MKRWIVLALLSCATLAQAQTTPAKKDLVAKLLVLQQPAIDGMARGIVQRPVMQLMQDAGRVLQTQVPPEKRETIGKAIEADIKKFVDESVPVLRERATALAPSTVGAALEEKFTEDELKQLIAWQESPVNKKYQQIAGDIQQGFMQKLMAEAGPLLDPKLQELQERTRVALGAGSPGAAASKPAKPQVTAPKPAKAASK